MGRMQAMQQNRDDINDDVAYWEEEIDKLLAHLRGLRERLETVRDLREDWDHLMALENDKYAEEIENETTKWINILKSHPMGGVKSPLDFKKGDVTIQRMYIYIYIYI